MLRDILLTSKTGAVRVRVPLPGLCVPVRLGRGVLRALARPCTAVYRVLVALLGVLVVSSYSTRCSLLRVATAQHSP
jgi:hypothetical protein